MNIRNVGMCELTPECVSSQGLKNTINELWHKGAKVGNNKSTADALRFERLTGLLVGNASHVKKSIERIINLQKLINKGNLSNGDKSVANLLISDLRSALGLK